MLKRWRRQPPILGLRPYVWAFLVAQYCAMALLLFVPAGTLRWVDGWAFLVLFAAANTVFTIRLERRDRDFVDERLNVFRAKGQPVWDRVVFAVFLLLVYAWLILAGLEVVRFDGPGFPLVAQAVGAAVMLASLWGCYAVMDTNAYLAPTVRVQTDRQHHVITAGPYRWVRHPFYAALIPFFFGGALLLGSRWAFAPAAFIAILFAYRCIREERHLIHHLEGYDAYRRAVRYRLAPYLW